MNDATKTKGLMSIFGTVIGYLYNCFTELVVVLIFLVISDYILGVVASYIQDRRFDREKAIKGILKKIMYPFILGLAFLGDYVIIYLSGIIGVILPVDGMIGIATLAYLIGTEGFSNAGHCIEIGLPVPEFLLKFFGYIRDQAGDLVRIGKDDKHDQVSLL